MKCLIEKDCSGTTCSMTLVNDKDESFHYEDGFNSPEEAIKYMKQFSNDLIKCLETIEIE